MHNLWRTLILKVVSVWFQESTVQIGSLCVCVCVYIYIYISSIRNSIFHAHLQHSRASVSIERLQPRGGLATAASEEKIGWVHLHKGGAAAAACHMPIGEQTAQQRMVTGSGNAVDVGDTKRVKSEVFRRGSRRRRRRRWKGWRR